jgi:phage gp16-like protein
VIEARHQEYNEVRMHSTIGDMTSMEFINTIKTGPKRHGNELF